jgi:hypothetical protein
MKLRANKNDAMPSISGVCSTGTAHQRKKTVFGDSGQCGLVKGVSIVLKVRWVH